MPFLLKGLDRLNKCGGNMPAGLGRGNHALKGWVWLG